uniref:Uncharacterized protein n=1 Tax=Cacopsylla melanoneura TaxID=428564 RepID=A0A8D8XVA7_9HEMI
MWCWRRMKKIKWTERVSNERVLEMVNEERQIWKEIQERRHRWIGHIYRHNTFVVDTIEGRREGAQGRGRPRMSYIKQIMEYAGIAGWNKYTYIDLNLLFHGRHVAEDDPAGGKQ